MYKQTITVGLVGPVNGGKSSVTNALAKDIISQMGPFQTTVIPEITGESLALDIISKDIKFNKYPIKTDDNDSIIIIELPGIICSNETGATDSKYIDTYLKHMDIVYWVTDIKTAFITVSEINEFTSLARKLKDTSIELIIMLSKYGYNEPIDITNDISAVVTSTNDNADDIINTNDIGAVITSTNDNTNDIINTNDIGSVVTSTNDNINTNDIINTNDNIIDIMSTNSVDNDAMSDVSTLGDNISIIEDNAIHNRYMELLKMKELVNHKFIKFNQFGRLLGYRRTYNINTKFQLPYRPIDIIKKKQNVLVNEIIVRECLNVTSKDLIQTVELMDRLTDIDAIIRIYKYIVQTTSTPNYYYLLCLNYFLHNNNSIFTGIDIDIYKDEDIDIDDGTQLIREALLLGLNTLEGLRKYYLWRPSIPSIDDLYTNLNIRIGTPSPHPCPYVYLHNYIQINDTIPSKMCLLKKYVNYDRLITASTVTCKKSVINEIVDLNKKLWGNEDDRDIYALIIYKCHHPDTSLFIKLS